MKISNLRSVIAYSLTAAVIGASACLTFAQTKPATSTAPAATGAAPVAEKAPELPVISINFNGLMKDDLFNIMLLNGGFSIVDQFFAFAVVQNALNLNNIPLGQAEVSAFKTELQKKIKANDGAALKDEDRERLLLQLLARQGVITQAQLNWYLYTFAGLNAIQKKTAPESLTLTEKEKADAQAIAFGESVSIYDFVFTEPNDGVKIIAELDKGTPIADVAKNHANAPMTIPTSRKEMIPADFHKFIFGPKAGSYNKSAFMDPVKKDNENKPIWHVIYVDKTTAANPNPGADKIAALLEQVREQKEGNWRNFYLLKLKVLALKQVNFNDPGTKNLMENMFNNYAGQLVNQFNAAVNAANASSQPATAPATAPK